jgi:hypothetical protein
MGLMEEYTDFGPSEPLGKRRFTRACGFQMAIGNYYKYKLSSCMDYFPARNSHI